MTLLLLFLLLLLLPLLLWLRWFFLRCGPRLLCLVLLQWTALVFRG
jgi:hypothetical protein